MLKNHRLFMKKKERASKNVPKTMKKLKNILGILEILGGENKWLISFDAHSRL